MTSDKRNFSDFHEFPGHISNKKNTKGWYVFPRIISTDSMRRKRFWYIYVRLVTASTNTHTRKKINWDIDNDVVIPLKKIYLNNIPKDIPQGSIAQIWTVTGLYNSGTSKYKATRSIPTYVTSGKNVGNKNETTVFTQALIHARSKFLKKKGKIGKNDGRFFPVAVHKYDASPVDMKKHIIYPAVVQRKLDGGRAVVYWDDIKKIPVMYSRALKTIEGHYHISKDLLTMFNVINKKYPGVYMDGELYKHGLSLQKISGIMRREDMSKTTTNEIKMNVKQVKLEYHIFDIFFPSRSDEMKTMPLIERIVILDDIFLSTEMVNSIKYLKKVRTYIANSKYREQLLYENFLGEKYEGSIVKNMAAPYEFGTDREIRSYQMRKRKPRWSNEYVLTGYTEGEKGKDKGAIIWILKTKGDDMNVPIEFHATPVGMDYEERYSLWSSMTVELFNKNYKGKLMTVEYDDISENGVPLRAKSKGLRMV